MNTRHILPLMATLGSVCMLSSFNCSRHCSTTTAEQYSQAALIAKEQLEQFDALDYDHFSNQK